MKSRLFPPLVAFGTWLSIATCSFAQLIPDTVIVSGTLTVPQGGLRWGQDTLRYDRNGTCSGSTISFYDVHGTVPDVQLSKDIRFPNLGFGKHPASAPCVAGRFEVSASMLPYWERMPPGSYSLYAWWSPGGPPPNTYYDTPRVPAVVRFDHPIYLSEIGTGVTPIGSNARYVDPAFAPIPLPPGMTSPQLIEISNSSLVGMSLPVTVGNGVLWVFDQAPSMPAQWRAINTGDANTFLSGNTAIVPTFSNPSYIAFSYTRQVTPVTPRADLWWGGQDESGWGLSIGRNGDDLFVAGFLYDYSGKPTWAVVQGGRWDSSHSAWIGDVYTPRGAPFDHYDASKLDMGSPVGKASIRFKDATTATFQYLAGYTHEISRFAFGPDAIGPYHGYWWGGAAQNGWGLHLAQQGDTLFATWYTYGADGQPTWLYMPGATKLSATHFNGSVYRTTGGSWPTQAHYDGSATHVSAAGTLDLAFTSENAGTMTAVIDGKTITAPIQRFGF